MGIDVSGDSTVGDVTTLFPSLLYAKSQGLPITLHIGESNKESAELQMLELTTIQPQRVGHGVHLCNEAALWVKSNQILVEMCLTSAIKTQMIREPGEHPALKLLLEGHPVSICTDDPLIFNTTLSQEYALVGHLTGLTPDELAENQKETAKYHFAQ